MTFARSMTLPPPTATIASGSSADSQRQGGVDRRARDVDRGLGEDRDVEAGERLDDGGEAGRAGDDRVRDHEHAAAVVRGDAAGGGGHPGAEQHLRGRAQDGEVGHRSASRNVVSSRLNSVGALQRGGVAAAAEDVPADVRQQLEQRQEAVAQRHDAVLRAVHEQHGRRDAGQLLARQRQVVDPPLARRGEQLRVPGLGERRLMARLDRLRRRRPGVEVDQLQQRARPLEARRRVAPQLVEPGRQRHRMPQRSHRDHPGHRARARAREGQRDRPAGRVAHDGERRDPERVDQLERLLRPRRPERARGPGLGPEPEQVRRDHPVARRERGDQRRPRRGRRPRAGAVQQQHGRPGAFGEHRTALRPGRRPARARS